MNNGCLADQPKGETMRKLLPATVILSALLVMLPASEATQRGRTRARMTLPTVTIRVPVASHLAAVPLSGALDFSGPSVMANIRADLRSLQQLLPRVIRAQGETRSECGDRIRLHRIDVGPRGTDARISVGGRYERWACAGLLGKHRVVRQGGSAILDITPVVRSNTIYVRTDLHSVRADGVLGRLLETGFLGSYVQDQLRSAIPRVFEVANLATVLPPEVRNLPVTLRGVRFTDRGNGRLGLEADVEISVAD